MTPKTKEIVVFEDKEEGFYSFIAPREDAQWAAGVRDTDADKVWGVQIYKNESGARAYAQKFIPPVTGVELEPPAKELGIDLLSERTSR